MGYHSNSIGRDRATRGNSLLGRAVVVEAKFAARGRIAEVTIIIACVMSHVFTASTGRAQHPNHGA